MERVSLPVKERVKIAVEKHQVNPTLIIKDAEARPPISFIRQRIDTAIAHGIPDTSWGPSHESTAHWIKVAEKAGQPLNERYQAADLYTSHVNRLGKLTQQEAEETLLPSERELRGISEERAVELLSLVEELDNTPKESGDQLLESQKDSNSTEKHPPRQDAEESSESHADRLLNHVKTAEFDSFQQYSYKATKAEKGFQVEKLDARERGRTIESDDLVDFVTGRERISGYAPHVRHTLEDLFEAPEASRAPNTLLCVNGERGGASIIQGAGVIEYDYGGRQNSSCFKIVFDSREALQDLLQWLQKNPNEALAAVLERAIGTYSPAGEFEETLMPTEKSQTQGNMDVSPMGARVKDLPRPFINPIKELRVKLLDSEGRRENGEEIHRNFEDSEWYILKTQEIEERKRLYAVQRELERQAAQPPEPPRRRFPWPRKQN